MQDGCVLPQSTIVYHGTTNSKYCNSKYDWLLSTKEDTSQVLYQHAKQECALFQCVPQSQTCYDIIRSNTFAAKTAKQNKTTSITSEYTIRQSLKTERQEYLCLGNRGQVRQKTSHVNQQLITPIRSQSLADVGRAGLHLQ